MKQLKLSELKDIKGGSAGWITAGIVAGITFLIGVIDGFARPFKCR